MNGFRGLLAGVSVCDPSHTPIAGCHPHHTVEPRSAAISGGMRPGLALALAGDMSPSQTRESIKAAVRPLRTAPRDAHPRGLRAACAAALRRATGSPHAVHFGVADVADQTVCVQSSVERAARVGRTWPTPRDGGTCPLPVERLRSPCAGAINRFVEERDRRGGSTRIVGAFYDASSLMGVLVAHVDGAAGAPARALRELNRHAEAFHEALARAAAAEDHWWARAGVVAAVTHVSGELELATRTASAWLLPERLQMIAAHVPKARLRDSRRAGSIVTVVDDAVVRYTPMHRCGVEPRVHIELTRAPRLERLQGDCLSPRQRQVTDLARVGATVDEIARALNISTNTVKYHLKEAYRVLGVASRIELAGRLEDVGRPT